jgi:hypothetical protein
MHQSSGPYTVSGSLQESLKVWVRAVQIYGFKYGPFTDDGLNLLHKVMQLLATPFILKTPGALGELKTPMHSLKAVVMQCALSINTDPTKLCTL